MKITGIRTYRVPPRWLFLKIETDGGYHGWGEAVLEGHAAGAEATTRELADLLIGRDPRRINDIWQMLYRNGCYRGGPLLMTAISGIDTALWDLLGKIHATPIHALLGGGQRDRVRTYTWIGGDSPTDLIQHALHALEQGFDAVKFNATGAVPMIGGVAAIDETVARVGAVRDAVGTRLDLALDFHGRVHTPTTTQLLRELEPFRPMWVEDPVPASNPGAVIEAARSTSIPIAVGERVHTRAEFLTLLESRAIRILNPDPAHIGGISETLRLAGTAESYDVAVAPHCPLGPIALAACLQIDAVAYNAVIQEQSLGIHYNTGSDLLDYVLDSPFEYTDGTLTIPTGPGLGVELNEAALAQASSTPHDWRAPIWRHPDNSIAEW
ncbi:galactonate dehydratase [Microbacterium sp. AK009]|uniref:galactonate dehydratase n=1 Tax=Microbacterium sp. AK009 TaxID=2723068 RepID=UPI0015CA6C6C|nr:galactonate dehydratase [Microbacterium sp. AK009]